MLRRILIMQLRDWQIFSEEVCTLNGLILIFITYTGVYLIISRLRKKRPTRRRELITFLSFLFSIAFFFPIFVFFCTLFQLMKVILKC